VSASVSPVPNGEGKGPVSKGRRLFLFPAAGATSAKKVRTTNLKGLLEAAKVNVRDPMRRRPTKGAGCSNSSKGANAGGKEKDVWI
jgi:hypothetical protein